MEERNRYSTEVVRLLTQFGKSVTQAINEDARKKLTGRLFDALVEAPDQKEYLEVSGHQRHRGAFKGTLGRMPTRQGDAKRGSASSNVF